MNVIMILFYLFLYGVAHLSTLEANTQFVVVCAVILSYLWIFFFWIPSCHVLDGKMQFFSQRNLKEIKGKKDTQLAIFIFLKLRGDMACAAPEPLIIV